MHPSSEQGKGKRPQVRGREGVREREGEQRERVRAKDIFDFLCQVARCCALVCAAVHNVYIIRHGFRTAVCACAINGQWPTGETLCCKHGSHFTGAIANRTRLLTRSGSIDVRMALKIVRTTSTNDIATSRSE